MTRQVADYVIVGAGSGGCAVAYRLTEAGHSVIVIEAGGSDAGPFINMPGALSYPMNMPIYDWGFRSEPEAHLDGRRLACPRGRVLGGSSSINGMVFVRGHPEDFEAWKEMGATGWGWADVLPYYRRMETWTDRGHGGDPSWRGQDGPLHVTRGRRDSLLTQAFVAAGVEAGYGATPDYNGYRQEGFGPKDATIRSGRRWSAYKAYLRPALATSRARIVSGTARKIVIENGRATGVEVLSPRGIETIEARSEVIIAASAINTPKLLTHSGIGAAATLQKLGIDVVADRPGVGQNLQDHLEVYLQFRCPKPVSLYRYWSLWGKAWVGALWLFTKTGPGASNQFESAGFVRSRAGIPYPDVQFHFLPIAVRYDGTAAVRGHGFQIHTGPMRSPSRGDVRVVSPDPDAAPEIRFNYMSHEQDWQDFRAAIRLAREVASQPAFDGLNSGEIAPGADQSSDEAIDAFIREHAESAYHPCGTARMGAADDRMSVVDPQARVIGVEGLRVADSSIFPQITNGNLNAPSILVGERVADLILEQSLPRDSRDWWRPEDWEETQREGTAAR